MTKIQILDNLVTKEEQEIIKNRLLSPTFPWFFIEDITADRLLNEKRPGFKHNFVWKGQINSNDFNLAETLIQRVENATGRKFPEIVQARSFLQLPLSEAICNHSELDPFHIDDKEDHWVILYYVTEYGGQTMFSDITLDQDIDVERYPFQVTETVDAKQGRIVLFDGRYYHTGNQVKDKIKCFININVR